MCLFITDTVALVSIGKKKIVLYTDAQKESFEYLGEFAFNTNDL
jgi:hypothetical protein